MNKGEKAISAVNTYNVKVDKFETEDAYDIKNPVLANRNVAHPLSYFDTNA